MRIILSVSLALLMVSAAVQAAGQSVSSDAVTFTKQVAPILQDHCQVCHRPDTFAPMSLLTYEEARPWARSIKAKVLAREMPPFFIDRNVGIQEFKNDVSLTDEEIATIVGWVDSGAAEGDPAHMPPARVFSDDNRWQFGEYGEPDLIVSLPEDYILPGEGPDHWPSIIIDLGLTEDRYLAGVQIIPTKGFNSIHHIRTGLIASSDEALASGDDDAVMGRFLNEYALGKGADLFPPDAARFIRAGTQVSVGLHMHPDYSEGETPVNIALGLKFHPKGYTPKYIVISDSGKYPGIDIRPHDPNARVDGYYLLREPTKLLSWQPHMHNRGKRACVEAIMPPEPDAADEGLTSAQLRFEPLNCARFIFNWHLNYIYTEDSAPLLPAGTMLHTIQWFDNSAQSASNTDPDAQVTHGQRTIDEMSGGWFSFYHLSEEEYRQEVEERRARGIPDAGLPMLGRGGR